MAAGPITLSNHAYVEWSSQFDCDEADEADEAKVITQVRDGVLIPGLRALEQRFGPVGDPPRGQMRMAQAG